MLLEMPTCLPTGTTAAHTNALRTVLPPTAGHHHAATIPQAEVHGHHIPIRRMDSGPHLKAASVEDNLEGLGRRPDGDGAEVLGIHVVGQGLGLGSRELVTPSKNINC